MADKLHREGRARRQFCKKGLMAVYLAFAHKFGRPPHGGDPVFFDPGADEPLSLPEGARQRLLLEAMLENRTAPQLVYAYCRTGVAVTGKERNALPPDRLFEWERAIREYLAFGAKTKNTRH